MDDAYAIRFDDCVIQLNTPLTRRYVAETLPAPQLQLVSAWTDPHLDDAFDPPGLGYPDLSAA